MLVRECMSGAAAITAPQSSVREAARLMKEAATGALPVGENDRLVGMLTDRDIAIRAVAEGKGADTPVRDIMTPDIEYCFDDEDLDAAARKMGELQVRRLPVLNRDKRLVGVISLGDISQAGGGHAETALSDIAEKGGQHRQ